MARFFGGGEMSTVVPIRPSPAPPTTRADIAWAALFAGRTPLQAARCFARWFRVRSAQGVGSWTREQVRAHHEPVMRAYQAPPASTWESTIENARTRRAGWGDDI